MACVSLDHACCTFRSADTARRVLGDCLGLRYLRSFTLPSDAATALFRVEDAVEVMVFGVERRLLEAVIAPRTPCVSSPSHVCFVVDDLDETLERCRACGLQVRSTTVGDHAVFFVADLDGNLFELKQG